MNIALVCAGGMSTSMLVSSMEKHADKNDHIKAYAFANLEEIIDQYDVILVGPQIRFEYDNVVKIAEAHGKKAALIDYKIFGQMNGKAAMDIARSLLKE